MSYNLMGNDMAEIKVEEIRSEKHFQDLVLLASQMHQANAPHLMFEPAQMRKFYLRVKNDLDRDIYNGYIAYYDSKPAGFIICIATEYFFSPQICARQELWYVDPAFRSTQIAFELMRVFESWAVLRGAVEIITGVMIVNEPERAEKIGKLLCKMKYPKTGSYHTRSLTLNKGETNEIS